MVCATVCLTNMPSFSDIADVSSVDRSFKTDSLSIPLFHITVRRRQCKNRMRCQRELLCRQLESNPQPSEQLRTTTMETCRLARRGHLPFAIHVCLDACIRIIDSLSDPCGAEDGRNPEKVLHIFTSELSVWLLTVRLESLV